MKFVKYIFSLFIFFSLTQTTNAHYGNSTYGCNLGNVIYTQKLGTTRFHGTDFDVYNANGPSYPIDWNNASTPNQVNSNNVHDQGVQCWVNSYVNPKNDQTGAAYGSLVQYTVNVNNLPLDDYIWVFMVIIGAFGAYTITKKELINL